MYVHACSVMSNSLLLHGLYPTSFLCPWNFSGKNTGVGCHFLCQGLFLTQGLNLYLLCLQHWVRFFTTEPPGKLLLMIVLLCNSVIVCFPDSSVGKQSTCKAGDPRSIPRLGRSTGDGKGYPLQYSGLENSMDCIAHKVTKNLTQLSNFHFHCNKVQSANWVV